MYGISEPYVSFLSFASSVKRAKRLLPAMEISPDSPVTTQIWRSGIFS